MFRNTINNTQHAVILFYLSRKLALNKLNPNSRQLMAILKQKESSSDIDLSLRIIETIKTSSSCKVIYGSNRLA